MSTHWSPCGRACKLERLNPPYTLYFARPHLAFNNSLTIFNVLKYLIRSCSCPGNHVIMSFLSLQVCIAFIDFIFHRIWVNICLQTQVSNGFKESGKFVLYLFYLFVSVMVETILFLFYIHQAKIRSLLPLFVKYILLNIELHIWFFGGSFYSNFWMIIYFDLPISRQKVCNNTYIFTTICHKPDFIPYWFSL